MAVSDMPWPMRMAVLIRRANTISDAEWTSIRARAAAANREIYTPGTPEFMRHAEHARNNFRAALYWKN